MESVLYDQFLQIVQIGDEDLARKFVLDHIDEFSESTKIAIMGGVFADILKDAADGATALADTQEKGIEAMHSIEKLKQELAIHSPAEEEAA